MERESGERTKEGRGSGAARGLLPFGVRPFALLRTFPIVIIGLSLSDSRKSVWMWGSEATLIKREPSAITRVINDRRFGALSEHHL